MTILFCRQRLNHRQVPIFQKAIRLLTPSYFNEAEVYSLLARFGPVSGLNLMADHKWVYSLMEETVYLLYFHSLYECNYD